jgi:predicted secreted protein
MPKIGHGSTLSILNGSTYDALLGVDNLNLDAGTADDVDVTDWDSTDGYEEIIQGIKRDGQVTFSQNEVPDGSGTPASEFDQIVAAHEAGTVKTFKLDIGATPDATVTFSALVKNYAIAVPTADKITTSITLRISGAPTWS